MVNKMGCGSTVDVSSRLAAANDLGGPGASADLAHHLERKELRAGRSAGVYKDNC